MPLSSISTLPFPVTLAISLFILPATTFKPFVFKKLAPLKLNPFSFANSKSALLPKTSTVPLILEAVPLKISMVIKLALVVKFGLCDTNPPVTEVPSFILLFKITEFLSPTSKRSNLLIELPFCGFKISTTSVPFALFFKFTFRGTMLLPLRILKSAAAKN